MISVAGPVRRMVHQDQPNVAVIIISSPIRLGVGGRARLAKDIRNHQVDISGKITWRPRERTIDRLCVRS